MAEVDPETLLEWLQMGHGEERDMQLIALEQLCMLLLMSDNVDRCFESCPPRTFLPALCKIFLDEHAPSNVLEVTARAITYYLDVSAECTRRIIAVEGAVKALCNRLVLVEHENRTSKDLAEQCIKVLEFMCTRESGAIFEAGGLQCVLSFIRDSGHMIHKDTLHSAMAVVSRLCGKMEPSDASLETCVGSLSTLLKHEDNHVSDGALRCFASLADRFTRRGVDPAPLAQHGLTEELLDRLSNCGLSSAAPSASLGGTPRGAAGTTPDAKGNANVSTVISLLSTLCRGSPTVTHDLLRAQLPQAIEKALLGDERCILDTMRLVDLLLVLLFEGRKALPKSSVAPKLRTSASGLRRLDSAGERTHRHLIDCIRSKDTDALIDAIDTGSVEVNYMDDVGQTLLNWASAFGTQEMVEFLCERGADVNRGQRSSSLHYAACFGRPQVAKTLLRHGANPDLRDEDGKTPLDKARERNDEGHREVIQILQSPGEWMVPVSSAADTSIISSEVEKTEDEPADKEPDGDPEMVPTYLRTLLPIFAQVYNNTMMPSVRKATLALIRKMVHYAPSQLLGDIYNSDVTGFTPVLVEVLAAVLDHEDDDEGHLTALQIIQDLMCKGQELFLDHFARLGVFSKVSALAGTIEELEEEGGGAMAEDSKEPKQDMVASDLDDAKEILTGRPYHWKDWCLARGRDCLYVWSDAAALELSNGSNGWFRFILDGKLATMYSSGSPEGGSDSSESRSEFVEKLQRARNQVRPGAPSQPILTAKGPSKLVVGNWSLQCVKEGELIIHNSDGQQATILKEDLAGFIFESNRGTKHSFTAETSLGPEFSTGWTGKKGKRLRSKAEQVQQKVKSLANELYHVYFKAAESHPRDVVAKLNQIVEMVERACDLHNEVIKPIEGDNSWNRTLKTALLSLSNLLKDENSISAYELHSSGLVQILLNCLNDGYDHVAQHDRHLKERISVFKAAFKSSSIDDDDSSSAIVLVRKLIAVLESIEKLPLFLYDAAGSACGLQVLTRRLRFRLERAPGETALIDRTGRTLKMEPLATVNSLERYLQKMVSFQWYDYERTTFAFVKRIKEGPPVVFRHTHDFDENGLIYWIGTNGKTAFEWVNPAAYNLVSVASSEGKTLPYGRLEDILSRDPSALNCHTNDDRKSWFSLDLGIWLIPSAYTLRHARGYGRSALRNWIFQVSKDGQAWTSLLEHNDDSSLNEPGSTATWPLEPVASEKKGWRYIRLQQGGKNASGQTHYLSLSGFEIYGTVTGVTEEQLTKPVKEPSPSLRKQQRLVRSQMLRQMVMGKGKDWKWCELMGEPGQDSASERESAFFAAVLKAATQSDSARTSESVTSLVNKTLSASSSSRQPLMSSSSGWQQHHHHQRQPQQPQQQQVHPPVFGRSKSNSTPSLSATEEAENKAADRDHASTSDLSRSLHPFTAVMESVLAGGAEGTSEGLDNNKNLEPPSQPESVSIAEAKTDVPIVPAAGTSSMSVSVPNLSSAKDAVSTLADSLPSLRRHSRGSVGSSSSVLSNRSNTLQSTFVRFPALASTLSDPGNFLSSAQSAPNLPSAVTTIPPQSATTNTTHQSTVTTGTLSSALATSLTSTSSESDNEFLETCRASSLLAELEDEDFCGEPEDLDDENEDDSGDDYDEFTEEDEVESRGRGRKAWDDEHVLRRQFSALVPAFDPRPGRTNVQQTTDIEISTPGTPDTSMQEETDTTPAPKLSLYLKGPGLAGTSDTQVVCDNMDSTIFKYVQNLYQQSSTGVKQDRLRRIWEPTYVVIYGERKEDVTTTTEDENVESPWTVAYVERHVGTERLLKSDVISMMQQHADFPFLRRWKLIGNARSVRKSRNCAKLVAAYREFIHLGFAKKSADQSGVGKKEHSACTVDDVLQLLRVLHVIANDFRGFEMKSDFDTPEFSVPTEEFYSKKINNKLAQQIQDPLVLSSLALPSWCEKLTHRCPMLFPFETRQLYFNCTAYGVSRAIVWLQGKREATTDRVRTPSTRREEQPEFQVGRLKHERVKVPRGEQLIEWGVKVMELHSRRKSILEVEFLGEEGTGLGPTLEFYALVAAELQKKRIGMWLCEDDFQEDFAREVDLGEGVRPPGFYIQRTCGLFPAPLVQDSEIIERIVQLFHFLGIFLAKCLQDSRMVDLPLSQPFLKLMCSTEMDPIINGSGLGSPESSSKDSDIIPMDLPFHASLEDIPELISDLSLEPNESKSDSYAEDPPKPNSRGWFYGILTWEDLELIDPHRAHFLRQLQDLVERKKMVLKNKRLTEEEKQNAIQNLALDNPSGLPIRLEDLSLTFCYNPPSSVYGYTTHNLKPNGSEISVTIENAEDYIKQVTDYCLHSGIKKQMEAFKAGFNEVFPMDKLQSFSSSELQTLMCGDQAPTWTREDVLNYTEPKLGYTRESPGFQKFVNVICSLNGDQRKSFLQFTTGCSSLPPGGLANLHPRLTIVRKIDANDHTYPSVNTCVHYLKLPEYTSEDIMKQRLLGATREKGFHLN